MGTSKHFEPQQINGLEEERLMVVATLPLRADGPQAAIWTSVDTWLPEALEAALGMEVRYGSSTIIIPFASIEDAQEAVRQWDDTGRAIDDARITLFVPDYDQTEQT